jgi:transcriptional regulator with XRE-family HTH domain
MYKLYENIKNARTALKMSQQELAEKLGYKSASTITKIESGENDVPLSKVSAFAVVLGTTPAALMGWNDDTHVKGDCLNPKTAKLAQDMYDNHRVLFDASRKLKPESLKEVENFIKYQLAKENC